MHRPRQRTPISGDLSGVVQQTGKNPEKSREGLRHATPNNFDFDFKTRRGNAAFDEHMLDYRWRWVQPDKLVDTNWADRDGDGKDDYPDSCLDFTFVGAGGPFVELSNNYAVFLYNVGPFGGPGLQYNSAIYTVTVEVFVNGAWSDPGGACILTMAAQPEDTEVRAAFCGGTYQDNNSNFILAETVYGATGYEWEFSPQSGQSAGMQTQVTGGISLQFHQAPDLDLSEGGDWSVRVRALAEGQDGSFSTACTISIDNGAGITPPSDGTVDMKVVTTTEINATLYPNPNDGEQLAISLSDLPDENQVILVEIFDYTGKVVFTEQLVNKGADANFIVDFDNGLSHGLYFVNLQVNEARFVEKLLIK